MNFRLLAYATAAILALAACGGDEDGSPDTDSEDAGDTNTGDTNPADTGLDIGDLDAEPDADVSEPDADAVDDTTPDTPATVCGDNIVDGDEACDDGNVETGDGCSAICVIEAGYTCVDNPSVCTQNEIDFCDTADCSDLDSTCTVGVCDSDARACVAQPLDDGDSCAGVDACTMGVCAAGVCDLSAAMDCGALDSACATGVCNADSGECVAQPIINGTECTFEGACFTGGACNEGVCEGVAVDCTSQDGPCSVGICNDITGICDRTVRNDGGECPSDDICMPGTCDLGMCTTETTPRDCTALDSDCSVGVCDADAGGCVAQALENGLECGEGDRCLTNPTCQFGACVPEEEVDCSHITGLCVTGVCNARTGGCEPAPADIGSMCGDADVCEDAGVCDMFGQCVGAGPRDCSDLDSVCSVGVCDDSTDACLAELFDVGFGCANSMCDLGGTCDNTGICVDTTPVDCTVLDTECTVGVCDAATGGCNSVPINDCGACGAGGRCVAGTCAAPAIDIAANAESDMFPDGFVAGGDADFYISSENPHSGMNSFHSGPITHSESSTLTATIELESPATLTFWLFTSSEEGWDGLSFTINGGGGSSWGGLVDWTEVSFDLPAGTVTLEWSYNKDSGTDGNEDYAAVDDITIGATCADGDACTFEVESDGECLSCPAADGDICDDTDACAPGLCNAGDCTPTPLDNGAACDVDGNDCFSGTCQTGSCDEVALADCSTCGFTNTNLCVSGACRAPVAGGGGSFDDEMLPEGWTTEGLAWTFDSVNAFGGDGFSLRSGPITHSGRTTVSAPVSFAAATTVTFQYRTSSESNVTPWDSLEFIVDDVVIDAFHGDADEDTWFEFAYEVAAGAHVIAWSYEKDGSGADGEDAVWIDNVVFGTAEPDCVQSADSCEITLLNRSGACVSCAVPPQADCNGEDGLCNDMGMCIEL